MSRFSYAQVGDAVNVASWLQDVNKQHGTRIIVSAETRRRVSRDFPLHALPKTQLKGKAEPVDLFGY
jgi:class 3 adenylate cyclase